MDRFKNAMKYALSKELAKPVRQFLMTKHSCDMIAKRMGLSQEETDEIFNEILGLIQKDFDRELEEMPEFLKKKMDKQLEELCERYRNL